MSSGAVGKIGRLIVEFVWKLNYRRWLPSLKYMGENVHLHGWIEVSEPENVSIGRGTSIHSAFIQGLGGITIGEYVHFGRNLSIYSANHRLRGQKPYPMTLWL